MHSDRVDSGEHAGTARVPGASSAPASTLQELDFARAVDAPLGALVRTTQAHVYGDSRMERVRGQLEEAERRDFLSNESRSGSQISNDALLSSDTLLSNGAPLSKEAVVEVVVDAALGAPVTDAIESAATDAETAAAATVATSATTSGAGHAQLADLWASIQAALRRRIRREQFETWFRRADLRRASRDGVQIAVQNTFAADWLRSNYRTALEQAVQDALGYNCPVELIVDAELTIVSRAPQARTGESGDAATLGPSSTALATTQAANDAVQGRAPGASAGDSSRGALSSQARPTLDTTRWNVSNSDSGLMWSSDVTLNPNYRFDNFVVGPCNRFAYAAAVGASESPGKSYNPFFLHGSVGLGKTHLLQSLCYSLLDRMPGVRILYLSCETFINHFISALENGDLHKFRTKYRNVDVLVVDDIHLLANKERTQEEFFHTFNTLYNANKQIVLSSDSPPKEIPTLQERLVSRFKWGLVTEIETPCYETRMAILKRKSRERGHELPEQVAQLLAEHIDSNIRELEGAVNRLISYAGLNNQEITPELVRRLLRDIFTQPKGQPTMDDVLRVVTAHFQVKVTELQSRRRTKAIAFPRQVAMFLARAITRHSLEEVGGFFGGRDHTTVLYAVEQIDKQMRADERFRGAVQGLLAQLQR
jgi:chromosomal replication initiator protein